MDLGYVLNSLDQREYQAYGRFEFLHSSPPKSIKPNQHSFRQEFHELCPSRESGQLIVDCQLHYLYSIIAFFFSFSSVLRFLYQMITGM